jgi:hypothetical protein
MRRAGYVVLEYVVLECGVPGPVMLMSTDREAGSMMQHEEGIQFGVESNNRVFFNMDVEALGLRICECENTSAGCSFHFMEGAS